MNAKLLTVVLCLGLAINVILEVQAFDAEKVRQVLNEPKMQNVQRACEKDAVFNSRKVRFLYGKLNEMYYDDEAMLYQLKKCYDNFYRVGTLWGYENNVGGDSIYVCELILALAEKVKTG